MRPEKEELGAGVEVFCPCCVRVKKYDGKYEVNSVKGVRKEQGAGL